MEDKNMLSESITVTVSRGGREDVDSISIPKESLDVLLERYKTIETIQSNLVKYKAWYKIDPKGIEWFYCGVTRKKASTNSVHCEQWHTREFMTKDSHPLGVKPQCKKCTNLSKSTLDQKRRDMAKKAEIFDIVLQNKELAKAILKTTGDVK